LVIVYHPCHPYPICHYVSEYNDINKNISQVKANFSQVNNYSNEKRQEMINSLNLQLNNYKQKQNELKQKFSEEIVERLQKFIDQNVNLTHLAVKFQSVN